MRRNPLPFDSGTGAASLAATVTSAKSDVDLSDKGTEADDSAEDCPSKRSPSAASPRGWPCCQCELSQDSPCGCLRCDRGLDFDAASLCCAASESPGRRRGPIQIPPPRYKFHLCDHRVKPRRRAQPLTAQGLAPWPTARSVASCRNGSISTSVLQRDPDQRGETAFVTRFSSRVCASTRATVPTWCSVVLSLRTVACRRTTHPELGDGVMAACRQALACKRPLNERFRSSGSGRLCRGDAVA